jgi:hypothetical protein
VLVLALDRDDSEKRSLLLDFIEVLASCTLRRISTMASRTAWFRPSRSPCSSTFLAAPWNSASTLAGEARKRAGERGEREPPPGIFLRRLDPAAGALGVLGLDALGEFGALPVYLVTSSAPPERLR